MSQLDLDAIRRRRGVDLTVWPPRYDPAYRPYGPGVLLRREMIARAFAAGLERYEFLGDDYPWKLAWTSDVHERLTVLAFAPSAAGLADWLLNAHARPLARSLLRRR